MRWAGATHAQADEARAKKIVSGVCFVCHGAEGESSSEQFPRLAGQHWEYIAKQLENFKSGKRKSTAMADMVAKLKPDEMVAIGKYFEKQTLPAEPPKDPGLAAVGRYIYHRATSSAVLPLVRQLPRQGRTGYGGLAAPGGPVCGVHRKPAQAVQQARAHQ
jgi:cytochrome c553